MRKAIHNIPLPVLDGYDAVMRAAHPRRTAEFKALRPALIAMGILWGRDCLRRHGANSFSRLTRVQLATIRDEIAATARVFEPI